MSRRAPKRIAALVLILALSGGAWTAARIQELCPRTETPTRVTTISGRVGIGGRAFVMRPTVSWSRSAALFPTPLIEQLFGYPHGMSVLITLDDDNPQAIDLRPLCVRAAHKGEIIERPVDFLVSLPKAIRARAKGTLPQWSEGIVHVEIVMWIEGRHYLIDLGDAEITHVS